MVNNAMSAAEKAGSLPVQSFFFLGFAALIWFLWCIYKDGKENNKSVQASVKEDRDRQLKEMRDLYEEAKTDRKEMVQIIERNTHIFANFTETLEHLLKEMRTK